jgi:hypothetical protein
MDDGPLTRESRDCIELYAVMNPESSPGQVVIGRVDYVRVLQTCTGASGDELIRLVREELVSAFHAAYLEMTPRMTDIAVIQQGAFEYIYDDYATLEAQGLVPYHPTMEARLVVAIGRSGEGAEQSNYLECQ